MTAGKVKALKKGCFSRLSDDQLNTIAGKVTEHKLGAGEVLIKQGETTGTLFVIADCIVYLEEVASSIRGKRTGG
eukprot:Awhi_evm1s1540